jgi:hypothetical protein
VGGKAGKRGWSREETGRVSPAVWHENLPKQASRELLPIFPIGIVPGLRYKFAGSRLGSVGSALNSSTLFYSGH